MNANLEEAASIAAEYVSSKSCGTFRSVCLGDRSFANLTYQCLRP